MDLRTLLLIGHIVGIGIGLGGATVSDIFFMRILKNRVISAADFQNLKVLSRVVWAGISLLIISGLGFLWLFYNNSGEIPGILSSPRFQAKLTLVAIVFINGLVFHFKVFPLLKGAIGIPDGLQGYKRLFAVTGAISATSWYAIVVFALLRSVSMPYWAWMGAYLAALLGGMITARLVIGFLLRSRSQY